jgi:RNA polymerase sigma-70 factor (ECF subfamily)
MQKHESRPEEKEILSACLRNDFKEAATLSLKCYGNEILGFLVAYLKNRSNVDDVFSMFLEDLWVGLPQFEWRCSMRAWAYTLARNAAVRHKKSLVQQPSHHVSLNDIPEIADVAKELRTITPNWMQTSVKNKIQKLRERLLPEDQAILILRVDRGLSWRELALVMSKPDLLLSDRELDLETQKFRKRFERIKAKIKRVAEREGLLQEY